MQLFSREEYQKKFEPLQPDPGWKRVNSQDVSQNHDGSKQVRDFGPAAYAQGFEDGAYALADAVWNLIKDESTEAAVLLLMSYRDKSAHPVKGWKQEPVRG